MKKTIAGFYDSSGDASATVDDLLLHGYTRDQITVLASATDEHNPVAHDIVVEREGKTERAEKGALLGGFAGLLVGLAAVLVPGVGPLLVLGPAATALVSAGIGATAGSLLGGLTNLGIPHEHAQMYVEGMRRGGTLLLVNAPEEQELAVLAMMDRHGAADLGERTRQYRDHPLVAPPIEPLPAATTTDEEPATQRVVIQVAGQRGEPRPLASEAGLVGTASNAISAGARIESVPVDDADFGERATDPEGTFDVKLDPIPVARESGRKPLLPHDKPRSHP